MSPLVERLKAQARTLGFAFCGITTPAPPPHLAAYENWLAQGRHGTMHYMATERNRQRRADPKLIWPECKSIIVVALPYVSSKDLAGFSYSDTVQNISPNLPGLGRVAAYALGDDYHDVIPPKLEQLVAWLEKETSQTVTHKIYTDTGPLLERELAQRAGLGWIGKNTMLINPTAGSYFLLAEALIDLELNLDEPFQTDQCGTCTRCLDACPTQAILEGRLVDARRCISYLTIELKEEIPEGLRAELGDWIFGCDICQTVCPWNRFAGALIPEPALAPRPTTLDLLEELTLTPEAFNQKFRGSPIKRSKRRGYLRNVAVALGNSQDPTVIPTLQKLHEAESDPVVREHLVWAIKNLA